MTWPNGLIYIGHFRNGKRHNVSGTMYFTSSDTYEGKWIHEQMHGVGKFTTHNGVVFRGRFVAGAPANFGSLEFPKSEEVYEGEV